MKHWPTRVVRGFGWVAVGVVGVSLAACAWHRPAGPDTYVGPRERPAAAPAEGAGSGKPREAAVAPAPEASKPAVAPAKEIAPDGSFGLEKPASPRPLVKLVDGPLGRQKALLIALENNQALVVERIRPDIVQTAEGVAKGVFDPLLRGTIGHQREKGVMLTGQGNEFDYLTDSVIGEAALDALLPTGTRLTLGASTELDDKSTQDELVRSRVGLTVNQALLRGYGLEANLARVREARIDTLISEYQLRGFVEAFVAQVEEAYWTCLLAKLRIEIFERAEDVARRRLDATVQRINAGTLGRMEQWAAEAGLAQSHENLINARNDLRTAELRLARLMNPGGGRFWEYDFDVGDPPKVPNEFLESVDSYVDVALKMRPDLNQARLGVQRGDLQIVRTRNGLLPQLDLFVTLGKTGYASSFGGAWKDFGSGYDLMVGLSASYPLRNRAASAYHRQAVLGRRQAEEALKNMEQLIQEDVRTAYIEVERTIEQIKATKVTLKRRQATYDAEVQRQEIGQSTEFQVARAQRNLVESENDAAQAVIDYLRAFVNLYRLNGSLLERRGVAAPGREAAALKSGAR